MLFRWFSCAADQLLAYGTMKSLMVIYSCEIDYHLQNAKINKRENK